MGSPSPERKRRKKREKRRNREAELAMRTDQHTEVTKSERGREEYVLQDIRFDERAEKRTQHVYARKATQHSRDRHVKDNPPHSRHGSLYLSRQLL